MAAGVQSAVGEWGNGLPGKGTHTGSTKERCAVDGEEDGDPVLDCQ